MVEMEELEVHSKSYFVRWVNVKPDHTISWSIQPHKKSLNFGLFKHPGHATSITPALASLPVTSPPFASDGASTDQQREGAAPKEATSSVVEKLKNIGLRPILWVGRLDADKISKGEYHVPPDEGGNYALVLDNTFSKTISKTATFVLLTYPTNTPPHSGAQTHQTQTTGLGLGSVLAPKGSPGLAPVNRESGESLKQAFSRRRSLSNPKAPKPPKTSDSSSSIPSNLHAGVLQKRRRKRHQGYARRFFSLDFTSSTLSYYHDRNSSALRGAIPLSLAVIGANSETREISIDSGTEIWHLRANNVTDFEAWRNALEKATKSITDIVSPGESTNITTHGFPSSFPNLAEEREWARVEGLVGRTAGVRDAIRRLAKDTDPKYHPPSSASHTGNSSQEQSPVESAGEDYFKLEEKRPSFWKRKPSSNAGQALWRRSVSAQISASAPPPAADPNIKKPPLWTPSLGEPSSHTNNSMPDEGIHGHLMAILHDLDAVVAEFSTLITESKQRRISVPKSAISRTSMESNESQEFFDAEDGGVSSFLKIQADSDDEDNRTGTADNSSITSSDSEGPGSFVRRGTFRLDNAASLFPSRPKNLEPLPLNIVRRRPTVPEPKVMPPSLIGFLRRNVGKDLSTISMPVSANEPLSLLQRSAEQLEYSGLLDKAANATDSVERLIYVTAFAVSSLSSSRIKERSIRKPFNPMLGETFELVREDRNYRFIAEKVSHRPVQLALHADSKDWAFTQSPKPSQKFWGKSSEIVTEGKARVVLHSSGECFSWSAATSFLRNIIAGEKYVEPVGTMAILSETTGAKAVVTFKSKGMFSGRSEDATVTAFDTHGEELPLGLLGTWTHSLQLSEHGNLTSKTIWTAGLLVDQAPKRYGFTLFAATLNEITNHEKEKLPPTDSRLRPDQRALEEGDPDSAEEIKAQLEEKQRARRKEMEEKDQEWRPRWFTKVGYDDEVVWKLRTGKDGYWEERARGEWSGVVPIFKL